MLDKYVLQVAKFSVPLQTDQKRKAVVVECDTFYLSQGLACRFTDFCLSTSCYDAQRPSADTHLSGRISELASVRRDFGYRRNLQLVRRESIHINHKRVSRIYRFNGLNLKY